MYTVGFIGIGSMGGALLAAVSKKLRSDIMVCDFDEKKVAAAKKKYKCAVGTSTDVARECRYIFLCMKPQNAEDGIREFVPELTKRTEPPIFVSIMAGVTSEAVRQMCGGEYKVIRIMPNIAAAIGESMTLCTHTDNVTENELSEFLDFMAMSGKLDLLSENRMDAGMALAGCGPAFACLFVEALADGAVACGISRASATEYALQTLIGTARLLRDGEMHPGTLKDAVCSPAGTTIEGIRVLEERGFRSAATEAVIAAFEKASEKK